MRELDLRILAAAVVPAGVLLPVAWFRRLGWDGLIEVGLVYLALFIAGLWITKAFSAEDRMIWRKLRARLRGESI